MITNVVNLIVTAYCHCSVCCGAAGQPTASGAMPKVGVTVAASRNLPFGSKVLIPGVGVRLVQDRLAKRFDGRLDVFLASHQAARQFGKRRLAVRVITRPSHRQNVAKESF